MKGITVLVCVPALVAAALLVACGGDGGPEPIGPSGTIGPDTGIAFIGRGPQRTSPNVYLVDADSGAIQQVTDIEGSAWWPTWSRDRQRLGFIAWPAPPATPTATPGGTPVTATPVTATPAATSVTATPTPTPDPEDIRRRHIVIANADGSDQLPIGDSVLIQGFSGGFSWSPDDSDIIYTALRDPAEQPVRAELRLASVADGRELPLVEERLGYLPDWSPDGTEIVFGAFVGELDEQGEGENELFLMDSDGSNVRQVTDRPGDDVSPNWSPDGTRIVWWGQNPLSDSSQTPTPILFMMDVASGQITELGEGSDPVWSPDGQHVAFLIQDKPTPGTLQARPNVDIYSVDVGTGERTQLTQGPSVDLWPTWSPDGQRLAFVSLRDTPVGEIYIMNADGSDVRRLTDNNLNEAMLAWAPR